MTSIKSLTTLFLAATFVGLGGCGQSDNRGQTDDSGMSDTAPTTTDPAGSASDPYATSPGHTDDSMTAPQSVPPAEDSAGSATYPADPGASDDMSTGADDGSTTEPGATPPPAQ